jgi:hypothetical protein
LGTPLEVLFQSDSSCIAFISFDLPFYSEPRRAKNKDQLRRFDSDTNRFIAPSQEQFALILSDRLHGISFRLSVFVSARLLTAAKFIRLPAFIGSRRRFKPCGARDP